MTASQRTGRAAFSLLGVILALGCPFPTLQSQAIGQVAPKCKETADGSTKADADPNTPTIPWMPDLKTALTKES